MELPVLDGRADLDAAAMGTCSLCYVQLLADRFVLMQGDRVRAGYPGYTGVRPKIQFWHGTM